MRWTYIEDLKAVAEEAEERDQSVEACEPESETEPGDLFDADAYCHLCSHLIELSLYFAFLGVHLKHLVQLLSGLEKVQLLRGACSWRLLLLLLLNVLCLVVSSHETEGLLHVF